MRTKTNFGSLDPGDRFFTGPRAKTALVKLPDTEEQTSDMGHYYQARVYNWVKEDFSKFYRHHSWAGGPDDVWIES